ncbi:hypothetical protein [Streptomyces sp. NPDC018059]|uniref:hypothetical protein n=1 Tax=Streptomyces sp. NPDC018059 TaxID=3365041 RepID=UPI00379E98B7
MGRLKKHKPRQQPVAPPFIAIGLEGPALALAWDANADQALAECTDKLVIVCPSEGQARAFLGDLAAPEPLVRERLLGVTDAEQWRGSRSDHPGAFLACLRYEDETPACEDAVRYRAFMMAMGQESIV